MVHKRLYYPPGKKIIKNQVADAALLPDFLFVCLVIPRLYR